eukprot:gene5278-7338_t
MKSSNQSRHSTIDIIEDCLTDIYQSRRSALLAKIRKQEAKDKRRVEKNAGFRLNQNQDDEKNFLLDSSYSITSNHSYDNSNQNDDDMQDEDLEEEDKILKELSNTFIAPPVISIAPEKKDVMAKNNETIPTLTKSESVYQLHNDEDYSAQLIFKQFCQEFLNAIKTAKSKEHWEDDDMRGEYCDYLIDKHLSHNLDKMKSTKNITNVRRMVANIIEEFASSGLLSANTMNMLEFPENAMNGDYDKKTIRRKNPIDEKKKIKEQYENYMALKKKTEIHPDNSTEQQYIDLSQDIQSLISSIQKK